MPAGLLRVEGTIDLDQFWPVESSDADTSKIHVHVQGNPFEYRPDASSPFAVTHALDQAIVRGAVTKPAIDGNGRISVRLQGVDAPELHYRPAALVKKADRTKRQNELYLQWNHDYRQLLAETATLELAAFLRTAGGSPLPCRVETRADEPGDVFDTYARFVGEIFVRVGAVNVSVNRWLLKNGWAFPAFYSSMTRDEIEGLTADSDEAWVAAAGVWPHLPDFVGRLDFDLRYRGKGATPDPAADRGATIVPKLFRRLSAWEVNKKAQMVAGSFGKYLERAKDLCYLTDEFLDQGPTAAPPHFLHEFVASDGFVSVWPEELVFHEKPSRVTGPGGVAVGW